MVTVGGEMSGYWDTGREKLAITPASVMMIASTLAKIGRSMKKREKLPTLPGLRLHDHPRPQLHEVVDDHPVAFLETAGDDRVGVDPAGHLHRARHDLVVGAGQHHLARLLRLQHGGL